MVGDIIFFLFLLGLILPHLLIVGIINKYQFDRSVSWDIVKTHSFMNVCSISTLILVTPTLTSSYLEILDPPYKHLLHLFFFESAFMALFVFRAFHGMHRRVSRLPNEMLAFVWLCCILFLNVAIRTKEHKLYVEAEYVICVSIYVSLAVTGLWKIVEYTTMEESWENLPIRRQYCYVYLVTWLPFALYHLNEIYVDPRIVAVIALSNGLVNFVRFLIHNQAFQSRCKFFMKCSAVKPYELYRPEIDRFSVHYTHSDDVEDAVISA